MQLRSCPITLISIALALVPAVSGLVQGSCVQGNSALEWLASRLSPSAAISCRGSSLELYDGTDERYWGQQYSKSASVVVFPTETQDVSYAMQARAMSSYSDFAFVGGGHGMTNASSSNNFLIDLSYMNQSQVVNATFDGVSFTAIQYQGGCNWLQVQTATNNTGYTAVGARVSSVGVGGFSTGGGIGFLAGAYGYAIDRLRAMEVVLVSGEVVVATKVNAYSDLFWALQGGGGQFGIVTKFYQEAATEPSYAQLGIWVVSNSTTARAQQNTVDFFSNHDDPFSLMYYGVGYLPEQLVSGQLGINTIVIGVYFADPSNSNQKSFKETFASLTAGLSFNLEEVYTVPYANATEIVDTFFPYGYRRGFWGPQTTNLTLSYLQTATNTTVDYINGILATGDEPISTVWALQYMYPGLNGNLPKLSSSTAWPHAVSAHQTLFSPGWLSATNDAYTNKVNTLLNEITYKHQATVGPVIADYPNYISPDATGHRIWGDNVARLISIKNKYDPLCAIHNGRVFASPACILGGWANIYAGLS